MAVQHWGQLGGGWAPAAGRQAGMGWALTTLRCVAGEPETSVLGFAKNAHKAGALNSRSRDGCAAVMVVGVRCLVVAAHRQYTPVRMWGCALSKCPADSLSTTPITNLLINNPGW